LKPTLCVLPKSVSLLLLTIYIKKELCLTIYIKKKELCTIYMKKKKKKKKMI